MPKFKVTWEVEDGYVGKSRPQHTVVDTEYEFDDNEWDEMSEDDKKGWIAQQVEDDFNSKISFCISDYGI
jgi:hypothetical protein